MRTPVWFLLDSSEKETILLKFIDFDFTHTQKLYVVILFSPISALETKRALLAQAEEARAFLGKGGSSLQHQNFLNLLNSYQAHIMLSIVHLSLVCNQGSFEVRYVVSLRYS